MTMRGDRSGRHRGDPGVVAVAGETGLKPKGPSTLQALTDLVRLVGRSNAPHLRLRLVSAILLTLAGKALGVLAPLVLGAAAEGTPGPLVSHFSGNAASSLPCPLVIVPGQLSDEALDRLS